MKRFLFLTIFGLCLHLSFARGGEDPIIPTMDDMLQEITTTMGLPNNFELKSADVLNIEAAISHRKKMIIYNPAFIDWINRATGDKWATMALIAHEMAHHIYGHTQRHGGSEPALELQADEYAGYVLRKLGASLRESQQVMYLIATDQASSTHPGRKNRMNAIRQGWERAANEENTAKF
jgi:hypothetical protein